jgi:hypothetical protein
VHASISYIYTYLIYSYLCPTIPSGSIQKGRHPPVPTNLPKTAYVENDSVPSVDNPIGQRHRRHIVYDPAHQLFYVANLAMNRVEVFSASNPSLQSTIPAPAASSVDLSADASTLWIATATEQILAVDNHRPPGESALFHLRTHSHSRTSLHPAHRSTRSRGWPKLGPSAPSRIAPISARTLESLHQQLYGSDLTRSRRFSERCRRSRSFRESHQRPGRCKRHKRRTRNL